ncbi:hypothetical protein Busp01_11450 [Trinickia caryophylli]|nr:hypothetical protein Busp01_11450 [Trinickia caryophylli]
MLSQLQSTVKRTLRATSKTVAFPFYTKTSTAPSRARPAPDVKPAETPPPRRMGPPRALGHKHERNIDAIVPQSKAIDARAEIRFGLPEDMHTPEGATRYIGTQWREVEANGNFSPAAVDRLATAIAERVLAGPVGTHGSVPADGHRQAASHAIMLSDALAHATGGDPVRAHAALHALLDGAHHEDPRVRADVLATQIALGASGTGLQTLLALAPHVLPPHEAGDGGAPEIRREAFRHALRAADHLLRSKPADEIGPTSLEELAALADKALPVAERARTNSSRVAALPATPEPMPAWLANPHNTLAIKALQAANALRADPAANCPPHQAAAYMAWRNGFEREGPGTDLEKTQQRFFKLFTYTERAAKTGFGVRALSGFLGKQKSPLSALQNFGTGGLLLGHPEQEFARFTDTVDALRTRLVEQIQNPSASQESKARYAVRVATLDQWQARMAVKGLRSSYKLSSSDLKKIEVRARALLPDRPALGRNEETPASNESRERASGGAASPDLVIVGDDEGRRTRNREAVRAELKTLGKMSPEQLRAWANESWSAADDGVPAYVTEKIDTLQTRLSGGGIRPKPGDANTQFDAIGELVRQMPDTYDVRFTSGGTLGVVGVPPESLKAFSKHLKVPTFTAVPDVGYVQGRNAVIDVGSNQHFGHIFIGSDVRRTAYLGAGAFFGWGLDKKSHFSAGVSGGLRRSYERGGPRGVTIRTRRSDNERPGSPDAWRTTMLDILDTVRHAGPNDEAPRNAGEMWGGVVQRFWKDPSVSINWTDNRDKTSSTTASAGATLRGGTAKTKWGPSLGVSHRSVSQAKNRLEDQTGSQVLNTATNSSGRATSVSASLVEGMPSAAMPHHSGHLAALSFPSQPYVGIGTTLFATNTNAALRIARDGDQTIPEHTFKDTEFGTFKDFKQFVDTYRSEWLTSLGGGDEARKKLDTWVARVREGADAGNLIMGERAHMTRQAGKNMDFLLHRKQRLARLEKPTPAQARELARIDADIRQVLGNENSWRRASLYVLESIGTQRTLGLSFLLNAQSSQSVGGVREVAALSASS